MFAAFTYKIKNRIRPSQLSLHWRHNERDGVSNHQPHDSLRLFRRRSKKTSKLRVTGLCAWNSPGTDEFPAQMASNAEMFPFDDAIMITYTCHVGWDAATCANLWHALINKNEIRALHIFTRHYFKKNHEWIVEWILGRQGSCGALILEYDVCIIYIYIYIYILQHSSTSIKC